jgi:hypothetical protein
MTAITILMNPFLPAGGFKRRMALPIIPPPADHIGTGWQHAERGMPISITSTSLPNNDDAVNEKGGFHSCVINSPVGSMLLMQLSVPSPGPFLSDLSDGGRTSFQQHGHQHLYRRRRRHRTASGQ